MTALPGPQVYAVLIAAALVLAASFTPPLRALLRHESPAQWTDQEIKLLTEKLERADWAQFTKVVSRVYEKLGFIVTTQSGDDGLDPEDHFSIVIQKTEKIAVLCKSWKVSSVTSPEIIEFSTALKHAGMRHGLLVTLRDCTAPAYSVAEKLGIEIVTNGEFLRMLHAAGEAADTDLLANLSGAPAPRANAHPVGLSAAAAGFGAN